MARVTYLSSSGSFPDKHSCSRGPIHRGRSTCRIRKPHTYWPTCRWLPSADRSCADRWNFLTSRNYLASCVACSMNGNIARFRMWNSKLDSATVLNDFNVERENFGYAPFVTSASFTLASNTPAYRALNLVTATVPLNSKVTFYANSKVIPGCKKVSPVSTTALCRWKPSARGPINVRLSYTTSGSATVNWAPATTVFVGKRTTAR